MLGILFLIGAAVMGACLVRRVFRSLLNSAEQVLWGIVFGWALTTLGVYVLACWQGRLTHRLMAWVTVVVWLVAATLVVAALRRLSQETRDKFGWAQYRGLGFLFLLFAPIYWRLFSSHMLAPGEDGVYSGGSTSYDLSFHAALASSFVYGENFPPVYTPLPPDTLLYPFLPDFQIATLLAAGMSWRTALITTALFLSLAIIGLIYCLALRIADSSHAQTTAVLATIMFLFNGGLGFIDFFRDWWKSGKSFGMFWNTLGVNYANAWERGIHWTNIIADTLLPQRTSLFGLPMGLMIITIFAIVWRRWHKAAISRENDNRDLMFMLAAGVLTGLLPLFHTHTYVAIGVVSAVLFFFRPRRIWIAFWIPAVLLAMPQLITILRHAAVGGGIVRFLPGWMGHGEPHISLYLLRNFGLPLLLALPAWLALSREWRKFYFAFIVLFIFAMVVMVSPNAFDNGKLTYYWHAVNSILVAAWLVRLSAAARLRSLKFSLAALLALGCIATGIAAVRSESLTRSRLFSDEELAAASFVREHTAPHALFLTAPAINQPVLSLAGRPVVRGATAWLWSHGYEFREREADVRRIYRGDDDALELLKYYGVEFVYVGDAEKRELNAAASFFEKNFPAVYRGATVTIYDTRSGGDGRGSGNESPGPPAPRELVTRVGRDPYALLVEFPRTSFFLYRVCKASYGRMPRRQEFMEAMEFVGRGLYIGANDWERQLDANQAAFLVGWTSSEEFRKFYEGKTSAEFVDMLSKNASLELCASERQALVTLTDGGAEQRQLVLRRFIEGRRFYAREYNTAYVLIHFFGYLGRNPDDPPDTNAAGLDYWRDILDRSGDYRSLSRAFLESGEYKGRQK